MSSPVQVVLNPQNFSEDREVPSGGGPRTDFYADDDAGFVAHKKVLLAQVKTTIAELERQTPAYGPIGFVKVILRRKAWAKSHRPLKAIFPERRTPLVGGLDIGQLLLEVDGGSMLRVAQEIHGAEDVVEWKLDERKKKRVPNPSPRRSEAGAIERIELYGPSDRRQFDLDQAVVWLLKPRTGGQYEVELFEVPPANNNLDAAGERRVLFQSFTAGLNALGPGVNASMLRVEARTSRLCSLCVLSDQHFLRASSLRPSQKVESVTWRYLITRESVILDCWVFSNGIPLFDGSSCQELLLGALLSHVCDRVRIRCRSEIQNVAGLK
jgi:hypothetical protein